jgi:hypothetical protein
VVRPRTRGAIGSTEEYCAKGIQHCQRCRVDKVGRSSPNRLGRDKVSDGAGEDRSRTALVYVVRTDKVGL